jgi:glycosyltransferase involved in cell wall biosynthesis
MCVVHEAAAKPSVATREQIDAAKDKFHLVRPFALYLGTVQPRKNLVRLIHAHARLLSRGVWDLDLVIAGAPGWQAGKILAEPARLGVADRVHFTGYLSEVDRSALLGGAHFFCYPSLFEGFGLPILEAQGAGVPVLTANNSSLPEVAGDAAILVDPLDVEALADAMLRLSQDEALRQRLIAAGHENVKRFSWEKAARETLAVLEAAAATRNTHKK